MDKTNLFVLLLVAFVCCTKAEEFTISGLGLDFWPCNDNQPSDDNSILDCGEGITVSGETPFNCKADPEFRCHVDFQRYNGDDRGIAESVLPPDPNNFPVLNTANSNPSITNSTWFSYFFRPTPKMNKGYQVNLTLSDEGSSNNEFKYETSRYFPLDGRGWGNYARDRDGVYRNYHFTFQIHSRFIYNGGETFRYRGDDDLWVFINNTLRIDLGGVHGPQEAAINLDSLGLHPGGIYPIDIFFCERHTYGSNFLMYTTLTIYCPWSDHCNICQGGGQSCCTCNDNNACTDDRCNAHTGACEFTPTNCSPPDKCHTASCNTQSGVCTISGITCNDNNACTTDSCNPNSGCVYVPIVCNDNNACTNNTCTAQNGCVYPDISSSCNDNNACTVDSCDIVNGCQNTPITCDDGQACTLDSCNPISGCTYTLRTCQDNNACTLNLCSNSTGCYFPSAPPCNDDDACTIDSCNTTVGCVHNERVCEDFNPCTDNLCNSVSGCYFPPKNCDDNDNCTKDSCHPTTGECLNINATDCTACSIPVVINCTGVDACHPETCFGGECFVANITCDDSNPCTIDSCADENGVAVCNNTVYICPESTDCVPYVCDETIYEEAPVCKPAPKDCNDGDGCTFDYCDPDTGLCVNDPITCENSTSCHPLKCISGECVGNPINCNDGNQCTTDSCVDGTCVFEPILCEDSTACHPLVCSPADGICRGTAINCNDGNVCTLDRCEDGGCLYDNVNCTDNDACTTESCNPATGCETTDIVCNDNNECTTDSCDSVLGCVFTPIDLEAEKANNPDKCFAYICDRSIGVIVTPVVCRPSDTCKCNTATGLCECTSNLLQNIGTTEAAIGAGAIIAIVIGAVAFLVFVGVGSKKGYDYFKQKDLMTGQVMSSGIYESSGKEFTSGLYESPADEV